MDTDYRDKKYDELHGRRLYKALLDFMMVVGISGATVANAVDGFGRRGRSTLHIEGISMNYPLIIEVVKKQSKLEPLLPPDQKDGRRQRHGHVVRSRPAIDLFLPKRDTKGA